MNHYYYFVGAALPALSLDKEVDIGFDEFTTLLYLNMHTSDYLKSVEMRKFIDLRNLWLFWQNKPIDARGNLSPKELEEALLVKDFFPDFVFNFLQDHEDLSYRLRHFPYLIAKFLQKQAESQQGFLKKYFSFERELQLVLTALRTKKYNRDLLFELQYEDPTDPFVAYILAQKDSESFQPPQEYEKVKIIYEQNLSDPEALHKALVIYRLDQITEFANHSVYFTAETILSYMAQLILVEDWQALNAHQGKARIEGLS